MKQAMTSFPPPTGEPNLYTMTDNPPPPSPQQQQALLPTRPKEADDSKPSPKVATSTLPHERTTAPHDTDTDTPINNLQELEDFSIHNSNLDDSVAEI